MMFVYGTKSLAKLKTCHDRIVLVAERGLLRSPYDVTIIHGWRGKELQDGLFESGASTKKFPFSKHNKINNSGQSESWAIDFGPWVSGRVPWGDTHIFAIVAGCFIAAANELKIPVRYGGDWDGDGSTKDQKLLDLGHLEIIL